MVRTAYREAGLAYDGIEAVPRITSASSSCSWHLSSRRSAWDGATRSPDVPS